MDLQITADPNRVELMKLALLEARKCQPIPTAFSVGCVIALNSDSMASDSKIPSPTILATGYSRELPGNTHAEANALAKARCLSYDHLRHLIPNLSSNTTIDELLQQSDVYTTMEPCSVRASGLPPCSNALIAAKIRCCYIGCKEPDDFVQCEGIQQLLAAGISVIRTSGLEDECLEVARSGH